MNAYEFEVVTLRAPVQDDLERANCELGTIEEDHTSCGLCSCCGKPRFMHNVDRVLFDRLTMPYLRGGNNLPHMWERYARFMCPMVHGEAYDAKRAKWEAEWEESFGN